jgi:nucleotide-binding universal stress UspA family protein
MYKRILVPTDGSPISDAAAEVAIDLARACGSDILALSVAVPEPAFQSLEGAIEYDPGLQVDVLLEQAREYVAALAARAAREGVSCVPVACNALDAAEAIADTARQHRCDLIVMGSHGRRGVSRLLAGSVAQAVLAYAPIPVLVLRPGTPKAGRPAPHEAATGAAPAARSA